MDSTWPVLPTQPDGDQPGLLLPPPDPWTGPPPPEEVTERLRPREVPVWVAQPLGAPSHAVEWERPVKGTMLTVFGGLFLAVGTGAGRPWGFALLGATAVVVSAIWVIGVPWRRARRRRRLWWVLTPERVGLICLAKPFAEAWVERGEVTEVEIVGERRDGSGTVLVRTDKPLPTVEDESCDPGGILIGRVANVAGVADQVGLLRYELS